MKICLTIIFSFAAFLSFSQEQQIDSIPKDGLLLNKGWVFQTGDNPHWSDSNYDDKQWQPIDPTLDIHDLPALWQNKIVWFRLRFTVNSTLQKKALALLITQTGASEIYMNGKLIQTYGTIARDGEIKAASPPWGEFIEMQLSDTSDQVLAVRFAVQKNIPYIKFAGFPNRCFVMNVMEIEHIKNYVQNYNYSFEFENIRTGIFFIFAILHLSLFIFYPTQKANLYFFIYAALWSIESILEYFTSTQAYFAAFEAYSRIWVYSTSSLGLLFLLLAIYHIFEYKSRTVFYILTGLFVIAQTTVFSFYNNGSFLGLLILPVLIFLESLRVTILAAIKKQRGSKIILTGEIFYLFFYTSFWLIVFGILPAGPNSIFLHSAFHFAAISLPIFISIFLANQASFANRSLEDKLIEVRDLSEKNIAQEKEKQQILSAQNETLEKQVQERTFALNQSLEDLKSTQSQLIQSEKMASLGELTAGIAHEIQNPLNFVNNFSEVNREMIDELLSEKSKVGSERNEELENEILNDIKGNEEKINHHGKRADAIVKNMLQHSRQTKGVKEPTDINALCDEYLRLSYHGLRAKDKNFNADFKTDFDETIGKINIVPQDIGRVLLNLYNNAFYAVNEKQKLLANSYQPLAEVKTRRIND
jgi:two-component system NtrC family sensor kinase